MVDDGDGCDVTASCFNCPLSECKLENPAPYLAWLTVAGREQLLAAAFSRKWRAWWPDREPPKKKTSGFMGGFMGGAARQSNARARYTLIQSYSAAGFSLIETAQALSCSLSTVRRAKKWALEGEPVEE